MQTGVNNLVQAVEVWRPESDGGRLVRHAGVTSEPASPSVPGEESPVAGSQQVAVEAFAEGLPIVRPLPSADQGSQDNGSEILHAIAIPSMQGDVCRGVLALLCGESEGRQGAFEVWRPNDRSELAITDSWYANLDHFGLVSQFVKFPRRAGLPGKVWSERLPRVMGSLGSSRDFVRVAGARADGLSTAIGIPVMKSARKIAAVMLMLSASRSPIASVMEVWARDRESGALRVVSADYGPYVDLKPKSQKLRLPAGEGVAGRVFEEQAPWVTSDPATVETQRSELLSEYGFEWSAGMPIFVGDALLGAVTLMR